MRETYCRTMIQRYASLVRNHCNKQIPAPRASRSLDRWAFLSRCALVFGDRPG